MADLRGARVSEEKNVSIPDKDFEQLRDFIYNLCGMYFHSTKKYFLESRITRRMEGTGTKTYQDYYQLLKSLRGAEEMKFLMDEITTNETYFFREPRHFAFLGERILATYETQRPFRVWSAACSSGEEPYSVAMLLAERLGTRPWEVLGSDISTRVLEQARAGVYPMERAEKIPPPYLKRYCLKGVGAHDGHFSIAPVLRERMTFREVNLNATLPELGAFDLILLRNVMIYFDQPTKRQVCQRLASLLRPGGHLFVGHSESLNGLDCALRMVQPAVYRKDGAS